MINSELRATIFFGYKEKFEQQIKSVVNYVTLTEMVVDFDVKRNSGDKYFDEFDNLVVYSDEYGSVNESVLQNFMMFVKIYKIKNIYVQNPPIKLVDNLKRFVNHQNINEINYSYDVISMEKIKDFGFRVSEQIYGQSSALLNLKKSMIAHLKFNSDNKPLVLMFYGPSGVGKTETSKILSKVLDSDSELFIKPFGMYQSINVINNLYGDKLSEGSFAKELLDRKSNVILIDEFDKANPVCFSAFYQLFDEGVYIDKNYRVNLKNSIIICTSNYKDSEEIRKNLGDPIYFRFDAFIKFNELSEEYKKIIIEKKYNKCMLDLDVKDREIIEKTNAKDELLSAASKIQNARKVESIVKDTLALILLDKLEENEKKEV